MDEKLPETPIEIGPTPMPIRHNPVSQNDESIEEKEEIGPTPIEIGPTPMPKRYNPVSQNDESIEEKEEIGSKQR